MEPTIAKVESCDFEEITDRLNDRGWDEEYRQIGDGPFNGSLLFSQFGMLRIMHEHLGRRIHYGGVGPQDTVAMAITLRQRDEPSVELTTLSGRFRNGCFTELIVERCAPVEVQGVDPSAGQIAFARQRSGKSIAEYREGNAEALPFPANRFDAATMALVIFSYPIR